MSHYPLSYLLSYLSNKLLGQKTFTLLPANQFRCGFFINHDGYAEQALSALGSLWRILHFLNVLYVSQQLGNRTLPRAKAEPWTVRLLCLRPLAKTTIRTFRKRYIRNPEPKADKACTAIPPQPPKKPHPIHTIKKKRTHSSIEVSP